MEFYENEVRPERAFLVSVDTGEFDAEASMSELYELTESAGAQPVGAMIQKREKPDGATCIGSGRLEELKEVCQSQEIDLIIFDCELSPTQIRNLEFETEVRIIDRTMLILDIFASRARSREGKLQVELAQLKYLLPRLTGKGAAMSRLGGGIGTRGPGESKLETDRRHIRRRLESLREQLAQVEQHRNQLRRRREKEGIITAAIVGYTNAGKSTLMNTLTDAGVLAEDKLFATLDPTTRAWILEDGQQILLTDTVGFIRKLPHHLIEAFRSTLEEARYSDIIFHVVDCSNPQMDMQMHVVRETLRELGITDKTVVTVFNKVDAWKEKEDPEDPVIPRDFSADYQVRISAKTGEGLDQLADIVTSIIRNRRVYLEKVYPYSQAGRIQTIRRYGQLLSEEYREDGIGVKAYVPAELFAGLVSD